MEPTESRRVITASAQLLARSLDKQTNYLNRGHFARNLADFTEIMEPTEAATILTEALKKESVPYACAELARGLATVFQRMQGIEVARQRDDAKEILEKFLIKETDAASLGRLAYSLTMLTKPMKKEEARPICSRVAAMLEKMLATNTNTFAEGELALGLVAVSAQMEPVEAINMLDKAIDKMKNGFAAEELAEGLAAATQNMDSIEACRILINLIRKNPHPGTRRILVEGLVVASQRLGPSDTSHNIASAIALMWPKPSEHIDSNTQGALAHLVQQYDSEGKMIMAKKFARWIADQNDSNPSELAVGNASSLNLILASANRPQIQQRAVNILSTIGTMDLSPLASAASLKIASEPLPCPLATQDLVDLLKMPTCLWYVRRVVLDRLGNRYGRRFATHWDFVRYAQEQKLNLDFTTPPQRPDPKLPPLFQE